MRRGPLVCHRFAQPWRSSDATLAMESGEGTGLYAVLDMIGRPRGLRWRRYGRNAERMLCRAMRRHAPADPDDLDAFVRRELLRHNDLVRRIAQSRDREAFGFCACFAAVHERECRLYTLGDCRAYRLTHRRDEEGKLRIDARLLTEDQNALGRMIREKRETVLMQSELMEMGKSLDAWLGMPSEAAAALLNAPRVECDLDPKSSLWLMTDGVYMPLVRAALDLSAERLTVAEFRLEERLSRLLSANLPDDAGPGFWRDRARALLDAVRGYADRRRAYRDDRALLTLEPSGR